MRQLITNEWLTIFLVVGLVCVVISRQINAYRFKDFLSVVINSKYIKVYHRDIKLVNVFDGFLFANFCIALSIFVCFIYNYLNREHQFNLFLFFKLLTGISLFFLLKFQIILFIGNLFNINTIVKFHLFQKITLKNFIGVMLWSVNIFLAYYDYFNKIFLLLFTGFTLLLLSLGMWTMFKAYQTTVKTGFFYILLYLCTLEIGPYIILYKVIKSV